MLYKIPLTRPYFPRAALSSDNLEFWIGRQAEIDRVVRGLLSSTETHYLITGYPGIGKTSFVSRVIGEWRELAAAQGVERILIFNLHFARPQSPEDVVKRLIGKVYFASVDGQFEPTKKLAERLELNYIQAQSTSLKETQAESSTHESGTHATIGLPTVLRAGVGASSKEARGVSRSLEVEKEYNLSLATSDFESVLDLLSQEGSFESSFIQRTKRRLSRSSKRNISSRTLFVFDQLDDLEFVQELSGFLNMPNASFLVVGGSKLQEEVSLAKEIGLHVLDNFDEIYLRCQWDQAQRLFASLIDPSGISHRRLADYSDYLNFSSHGLPRRLFASLDRHTKRDGNAFSLELSASEQKRVQLCARLHRILWKHRKEILGSYIDSVQHPLRDKALRGAYHLTDRIFRVSRFSYDDLNTVATSLSAAIIHPKRERVLRNLLRIFESYSMLVKDGSEYRLSEEILNAVRRIPDWLKDGYFDARELLEEVEAVEKAAGSASRVAPPRRRKAGDQQKKSGKGARRPPPSKTLIEETSDRPTGPIVTDQVSLALRPGGREGEVLGGRYVISAKLGQGGMSEVYTALDSALLNRTVVVKLMLDRGRESDWLRRKFQHEIEALIRVDHPGIVRVLDAGKAADGCPYIVMEYVEGTTLRTVLHLHPEGLPLDRVSKLLAQIASALKAAHRHGIIHRDLKPENVIVTTAEESEDIVRLIDFGVARVKESIMSETTTGRVVAGTVMYMSPEQLRGEKITNATDIYSLGVITYEMVTGRRPHYAETVVHLAEMQRGGVSALPREFCPALSRAAQDVILKALSFNPTERYQNASDFAETFAQALAGH